MRPVTLILTALAVLLSSCGASLRPPRVEEDGRDDALVITGEGPAPLQLRLSYANREALLGYGGVQMWARPEHDEIRVSAIVDAPAKEARWVGCVSAWLEIDGRRQSLAPRYIGRPMQDGVYDAVQVDLGVQDLRRIAGARVVRGGVCGDPFEITRAQREDVARFVEWFDRLAVPRQDADAPGFREVGPRIELLPHEDDDPGPYEA